MLDLFEEHVSKWGRLLFLRILGLIEEEVGCKLLVFVTSKVSLDNQVSVEAEAAQLDDMLANLTLNRHVMTSSLFRWLPAPPQ